MKGGDHGGTSARKPPPPPKPPVSAPPEATVRSRAARTPTTEATTSARADGERDAIGVKRDRIADDGSAKKRKKAPDGGKRESAARGKHGAKTPVSASRAKALSPSTPTSPKAKPPPPKPPPPRPPKPPPPRPPKPPVGEPPIGFMETKRKSPKTPVPKPESSEDESEPEEGELPRLVALYTSSDVVNAQADGKALESSSFPKPALDVTEHELMGGGEFDSIENLVRQSEDADETSGKGFNNFNSPQFKKREQKVVFEKIEKPSALRLNDEYASLLDARKLALVLDLDHTLLNSVFVPELRQTQFSLASAMRLLDADVARAEKLDNALARSVFHLPHLELLTKLRPGVRKFLQEASNLFELHVNTMGSQIYADHMVNLLDPRRLLIKGTVKGLGEMEDGVLTAPTEKTLDGPLRAIEDACLIFDDTASVWASFRKNLITCERYLFFPQARRQFGLPGLSLLDVGQDESEHEGMLSTAMKLMKSVHGDYFKRYDESGNAVPPKIQDILQEHRECVLAGVCIVFSRVFPLDCDPKQHPLWTLAEDFGAKCSTQLQDDTTHVVGVALSTDKVKQALKRGCFCVTPHWLECSMLLWRRAQESAYTITRP